MLALPRPRKILLGLIAVSATCLISCHLPSPEHIDAWAPAAAPHVHHILFLLAQTPVQIAAKVVLLAAAFALMASEKSMQPVSLLDFHCFKPPEELRRTKEEMMADIRNAQWHSEEEILFMEKVLDIGGLGGKTAFSKGLIRFAKRTRAMAGEDISKDIMQKSTWEENQEESDMVIEDCVSNLLAKTGISAQQVDIVIVSCTCFIPVPSMAARIVNRFKMREDVLTYNLGGMGCSASLVSIDLAKRLLESMPNKRALIIAHENITNCYYIGHERKFMLVNCLFRMGGAAALMTNRPDDRAAAKYELKHTVRVHTGRDDECFSCIGLAEDKAGNLGMFLERSVVKVAGKAIAKNLRVMGRKVLPYIEQFKVFLDPKYVPKFTTAFEHFLIHTGGRGVLDEMEKTLQLDPKLMVPSRDVLWRFGNTSAASTFYILSHIEHNGNIRKGDRVFQLGFGGGFKANSAAWTACRNISQTHSCWLDDETDGAMQVAAT